VGFADDLLLELPFLAPDLVAFLPARRAAFLPFAFFVAMTLSPGNAHLSFTHSSRLYAWPSKSATRHHSRRW